MLRVTSAKILVQVASDSDFISLWTASSPVNTGYLELGEDAKHYLNSNAFRQSGQLYWDREINFIEVWNCILGWSPVMRDKPVIGLPTKWRICKIMKDFAIVTNGTRKSSIEGGIRRNAICYSTWNEIQTLEMQSYPCTAAILSAILEFVIRFLLNIYNWCPVSLRTIQWKNEVSTLINGWVTANYSVSRPQFCPPSWYL